MGKFYFLILSTIFLVACQSAAPSPKQRAKKIDNSPELGGYLARVEIPAGTNKKIEFDVVTDKYVVDQKDGQERVIDFLPYPANYGYFPNTEVRASEGGDGDPLDVLILSESLPTGTEVRVLPIAALRLLDEGQLDTKIIAVPADTSFQIMRIRNYQDLVIQYNGVQRIVETWFLNYDGLGTNQLLGWESEVYAKRALEKWRVE